jgi:hypothetical protein
MRGAHGHTPGGTRHTRHQGGSDAVGSLVRTNETAEHDRSQHMHAHLGTWHTLGCLPHTLSSNARSTAHMHKTKHTRETRIRRLSP